MTAPSRCGPAGAGATSGSSIVRAPRRAGSLPSPPLPAPAGARALAALGPQQPPPGPPIRPGRRESAQPASSDRSSPDEERRRPAFLLSIFSCRCCSRSYSRCHLRTPQAGGGRGRGGGKRNRKVSSALAQESARALRPEVIRASHLHPEVASRDLFSSRVAACPGLLAGGGGACVLVCFSFLVALFSSLSAPATKEGCEVLTRDLPRFCRLGNELD